MANELKTQGDLKLAVPEGVNAHLLCESHNPVKKDKPIARVGYWLSTDETGEIGESVWFEVNGDLDAAQAVLNKEVAQALKEATEPTPVVAPKTADKTADKTPAKPTEKK